MAGCIVIPQEQVLTIASEFGGLESMQFSPGLESCRWTVHHGSGFSKLAILDTLYLCLRHSERDRLQEAGA